MSDPTEAPKPLIVTSEDADLLRLFFGDYAEEVAEIMRRPREVKRYIVPPQTHNNEDD